MAKIHTVEWTPAILPHPVIQIAMNANWYGLAGEELQEIFEFLNDSEILGGIIGSHADHHAAPYSLTEEFVAVYRMHPLIPDDLVFRSARDRRSARDAAACPRSPGATRRLSPSVSRCRICSTRSASPHPGAITLHNYPQHLAESAGETTASISTWPQWTSCATASAACRDTTTSRAG